MARDQNLPRVMIAEDDVKFTAIGAFKHFLNNEPADYDLYLASTYFGKIEDDNSIKDFSGAMLTSSGNSFMTLFYPYQKKRILTAN